MAQLPTGLILLAVCVATVLPEGSDVVEETGSVEEKDGSVTEVRVLSDTDCRLRQETSKHQDGSTSIILMDFAKGKRVLVKSTAPDVCYVSDIPEDEMELQDEYCKEGQTGIKPGVTDLKKKRVYEARGKADPEDLSDDLKDACKGRRLVALVEVTAPDRAVSKRGQCRTVMRNVCKKVQLGCSSRCVKYGWFFGSGSCKQREHTCTYGTDCSDTAFTICK